MKPSFHILVYLSILIALLQNTTALAQWQINFYTDIGVHNASDGGFVRMANVTGFDFDKSTLEAGFQTDLLSHKPTFFSGLMFRAGREFQIGDQKVQLTGLYTVGLFSDLMHELNRGLYASTQHKNFHFELGTHFRSYVYNKKAREEYNMQGNSRLTESWNLIYRIGYSLKPLEHPWNISLVVTNLDHFLIHQETNPMLQLSGKYNISRNISLHLDGFYQQAGLFNINIHYFGFYLRPGIKWQIQ